MHRHALLLAARQLAGKLLRMSGQPDAIQQLQTFISRGGFVALQHFYLRQHQVIDDAEVGKQLEVLEHHADLAAQLRQIGFLVVHFGTVHQNIALLNRLQTVNGFDQGRFARARRPAHYHHFPFLDFGRAVGQHLKVTIPLRNIFQANHLNRPFSF